MLFKKMKNKFNAYLCVHEISYRLSIYNNLLKYYNSRIEENKKYNVKPWYYKALLSILDLKLRYKKYNPETSDISITMIINTYYLSGFPVMNDTTLKYYFPELYNASKNKSFRKLFKNDSERIQAIKIAIEECLDVLETVKFM